MTAIDRCKERVYLITKNNVSKIVNVKLTSEAYLARADENDITAMTIHKENYTTSGTEDNITIEEIVFKNKKDLTEKQIETAVVKYDSNTYGIKTGVPLVFISKFRTINHNTLVYMCYDKVNLDIVLLPSLNCIFYIDNLLTNESITIAGVTVGYGSEDTSPLSTIVNSIDNKLPIPELNPINSVDVNLVAINNIGKGAFLGSNVTYERMVNDNVNLTGQSTAPITMVKLGNLKDIFKDKQSVVPLAVLGQFDFRNTVKTPIRCVNTQDKEGPLYLVCKL